MLTNPEEIDSTWLVDGVTSFGDKVADLVPGFPEYRRLFHRPPDGRRWRAVATANHRIPHPLMQWGRISSPQDDPPSVGAVDLQSLLAFADHVHGTDLCVARWVGWAGLNESRVDLRLPNREYSVARAELSEVASVHSMHPIAYLWPEDHAWLFATGIDFDSTIIALGEDLARTLDSDGRLELAELHRGSSLAHDADVLN